MSRRKINTIIRTVFLVVSIINQFVSSLGGLLDIFPNEKFYMIYNTASVILTAAASALAWWYNNSITPEAQEADEYLDALKSIRKKKIDDDDLDSDFDAIIDESEDDEESDAHDEDNR